eukprot:GHVL01027030.1.p1 GENE.GHVL01027030.1~~GHVL01027030.1.p1  ORF type:complete len:672 (-),score=121.21 GHVL01027030.1:2527-4542(-)
MTINIQILIEKSQHIVTGAEDTIEHARIKEAGRLSELEQGLFWLCYADGFRISVVCVNTERFKIRNVWKEKKVEHSTAEIGVDDGIKDTQSTEMQSEQPFGDSGTIFDWSKVDEPTNCGNVTVTSPNGDLIRINSSGGIQYWRLLRDVDLSLVSDKYLSIRSWQCARWFCGCPEDVEVKRLVLPNATVIRSLISGRVEIFLANGVSALRNPTVIEIEDAINRMKGLEIPKIIMLLKSFIHHASKEERGRWTVNSPGGLHARDKADNVNSLHKLLTSVQAGECGDSDILISKIASAIIRDPNTNNLHLSTEIGVSMEIDYQCLENLKKTCEFPDGTSIITNYLTNQEEKKITHIEVCHAKFSTLRHYIETVEEKKNVKRHFSLPNGTSVEITSTMDDSKKATLVDIVKPHGCSVRSWGDGLVDIFDSDNKTSVECQSNPTNVTDVWHCDCNSNLLSLVDNIACRYTINGNGHIDQCGEFCKNDEEFGPGSPDTVNTTETETCEPSETATSENIEDIIDRSKKIEVNIIDSESIVFPKVADFPYVLGPTNIINSNLAVPPRIFFFYSDGSAEEILSTQAAKNNCNKRKKVYESFNESGCSTRVYGTEIEDNYSVIVEYPMLDDLEKQKFTDGYERYKQWETEKYKLVKQTTNSVGGLKGGQLSAATTSTTSKV